MTQAATDTACPIPCNICGGSDVDELSRRARDGRPLRTTICRRCGLVWSNPRPTEAEVRRYYTREYRLDYKGAATPSLRHVARSGRGAINRYQELAPLLQPGARVLDVGAGGGEVVYVLRRKGYDARGLEPDERYARHAREVLGVPVDTGFVQDAAYPPRSFDGITMYHALEHVEDPVAILRALAGWLAPEGVLLVEVPNVEAPCVHPSHRFHFAHFYNFNRVTLEAAARRAGLTPVRASMSPDEGNLIAVFRRNGRVEDDAALLVGNYARVARAVRGHTVAGYYLSRFPYGGVIGRLRTYVIDRAAAQGHRAPRELLDALLQHT